MSNAAVVVPQCTHIKTNGEVCGSPAVSGTELCYHHSKVKTALGKWTPADQAAYGEFTPIPFIFPEDRASMQINFFLLLQAFNEQRIDQRTFRLMLSTLKAMAKNLGKTGSLVEPTTEGAPSLTSANRGPHGQVSVRGVEKRESRVGEKNHALQLDATGSCGCGTAAGEVMRSIPGVWLSRNVRSTSGSCAMVCQASRTSRMQLIASLSRAVEASRDPSMHSAKIAA